MMEDPMPWAPAGSSLNVLLSDPQHSAPFTPSSANSTATTTPAFATLDDAAALLDLGRSQAAKAYQKYDGLPACTSPEQEMGGRKQSGLGLPWHESNERRAAGREAVSSLAGWDGVRHELAASPFRSDEPLRAHAPPMIRRESAPTSHQFINGHSDYPPNYGQHFSQRHSLAAPGMDHSLSLPALHREGPEPLFLRAITNRTQSYGGQSMSQSYSGGSFSAASQCPSLMTDCPSPGSSRASFATDGGWPAPPHAPYGGLNPVFEHDHQDKHLTIEGQFDPRASYASPRGTIHRSYSEQNIHAHPVHVHTQELSHSYSSPIPPRPYQPARSQSVGGEAFFPLPARVEELAHHQTPTQAGRSDHSRKRSSPFGEQHHLPAVAHDFSPFTPGYSMRSTAQFHDNTSPVGFFSPQFAPPASSASRGLDVHPNEPFAHPGELSPRSLQARELFADSREEHPALHNSSPVETFEGADARTKRRRLPTHPSPLGSPVVDLDVGATEHANNSLDLSFGGAPELSVSPPLGEPATAVDAAFVDNAPPPALLPPASPSHLESLPSFYPVDQVALCHMSPPEEDFDCLPSATPRQQKLRFEEDQYTPLWVRYEGQRKEGWCALCPNGGKWLQLKNSAFWYHRQFQHGISSVSGHPFLPPLDTRPTKMGEKTEGQCHSCGDWVIYANHARGGALGGAKGAPNVWFRHAHACHSYFSPKREAKKTAKINNRKTRVATSSGLAVSVGPGLAFDGGEEFE